MCRLHGFRLHKKSIFLLQSFFLQPSNSSSLQSTSIHLNIRHLAPSTTSTFYHRAPSCLISFAEGILFQTTSPIPSIFLNIYRPTSITTTMPSFKSTSTRDKLQKSPPKVTESRGSKSAKLKKILTTKATKDASASPISSTSNSTTPSSTLVDYEPSGKESVLRRAARRAAKALKIKTKQADHDPSKSNQYAEANSPTNTEPEPEITTATTTEPYTPTTAVELEASSAPTSDQSPSPPPTASSDSSRNKESHEDSTTQTIPSTLSVSSGWTTTYIEGVSITPQAPYRKHNSSPISQTHDEVEEYGVTLGTRPPSLSCAPNYAAMYIENSEQGSTYDGVIESQQASLSDPKVSSPVPVKQSMQDQKSAQVDNSSSVHDSTKLNQPTQNSDTTKIEYSSTNKEVDISTIGEVEAAAQHPLGSLPEDLFDVNKSRPVQDTVDNLRDRVCDLQDDRRIETIESYGLIESIFNSLLGNVDKEVCRKIFKRRGFKGLLHWFEAKTIERDTAYDEAMIKHLRWCEDQKTIEHLRNRVAAYEEDAQDHEDLKENVRVFTDQYEEMQQRNMNMQKDFAFFQEQMRTNQEREKVLRGRVGSLMDDLKQRLEEMKEMEEEIDEKDELLEDLEADLNERDDRIEELEGLVRGLNKENSSESGQNVAAVGSGLGQNNAYADAYIQTTQEGNE